MKKSNKLTKEEREQINAALTEQLAEAYPDLAVTPYKGGKAADKGKD